MSIHDGTEHWTKATPGGDPTKITQAWLEANGFEKVHVNPAYNGGFFRYYLSLPEPSRAAVMVSFLDGYEHEDGFMVWLCADMTYISMKYIRTVADLSHLVVFVCGKSLFN